ncbi:MAG: polysaccharide biosynthesis/export family protein [Roseovarius sp.]
MRRIAGIMAALGLMALAAGCTLPRGAAVQSEVIRERSAAHPSFQVVEVTRARVAELARWPYTGDEPRQGWFRADRGPDSALIRTGDRIDVVVWDNQDNSLLADIGQRQTKMPPLTVSETGTIFLPYVGEVMVRGLTPDAARARVQQRMEEVIPAAQVHLSVAQGRMNSVDVVSGVGNPGRFALQDRNTRLLSVLAQAGGVDSTLRHPRIRLQRDGRAYSTRLAAVLENPSLNVRLQGGDQIAVVEDERSFTAIGAAQDQRLVYFQKEEMSALDAISAAGGLDADRADPKGVLILREYHPRQLTPGPDGPDLPQVVFAIDLTSADGLFAARKFQINPNDTVLMTESPLTSVRTILTLVGAVVGISANANRIND